MPLTNREILEWADAIELASEVNANNSLRVSLDEINLMVDAVRKDRVGLVATAIGVRLLDLQSQLNEDLETVRVGLTSLEGETPRDFESKLHPELKQNGLISFNNFDGFCMNRGYTIALASRIKGNLYRHQGDPHPIARDLVVMDEDESLPWYLRGSLNIPAIEREIASGQLVEIQNIGEFSVRILTELVSEYHKAID